MHDLLIGDRADVLVLDDQAENLRVLVDVLMPEHNVHPFITGQALLDYVQAGRPTDLVMLDVVMPAPDGYEMCRRLREMPEMEDIPIVFLSALDSADDEARGLALGAVDYVGKPIVPAIVRTRVAHHLRLGRAMRLIVSQNEHLDARVTERTAELARQNQALQHALAEVARTQEATIVALTSLAETRDNETGMHIRRTQHYVRELALALLGDQPGHPELDAEAVELMAKSAALHDIGKVATPDHILLKRGKLTPDEFEVMKLHTVHGRSAIAKAEAELGSPNSYLRHARDIAYGHHERWDGQGYPQGLSGEAIPLSARLMAVADVYDALISRRPYKEPMTHAQAAAMVLAGAGSHFDPQVVALFEQLQGRFAEIATRLRDED